MCAAVCISLHIWICPLSYWCSFSPFKTFVIAEIFFLSILMWLYIISNDLFSMSFLSKDWIWEIEKSIMFAEKHYFLFQKFIYKLVLQQKSSKIKIAIIVVLKYLKLCIQIEFHTSMQRLKRDKREVSLNCLVFTVSL